MNKINIFYSAEGEHWEREFGSITETPRYAWGMEVSCMIEDL